MCIVRNFGLNISPVNFKLKYFYGKLNQWKLREKNVEVFLNHLGLFLVKSNMHCPIHTALSPIFHLSLTTILWSRNHKLYFTDRKQKQRERKWFTKGHEASKWKGPAIKSRSPDSKSNQLFNKRFTASQYILRPYTLKIHSFNPNRHVQHNQPHYQLFSWCLGLPWWLRG